MDKKIKDLLDEFYKDTWKPVPVIEYLPEETLISKKYQFIERLISKDKIDLNELVKLEIASGWDFEGEKVEREDNSREFYILFYTEVTLMLLSIHNDPINALLNILK